MDCTCGGGFFIGRSALPAWYFCLIIILAGDIEPNPGPSRCHHCHSTLRTNVSHLSCSHPLCSLASHKHTACSGLPRARQNDGDWTCPNHSRRPDQMPPQDMPQHSSSPHELRSCHARRKTIRTGQTPLSCASPDCRLYSHKQTACSGLPRSSSNNPLRWHCPLHRIDQPQGLRATLAGRAVQSLAVSAQRTQEPPSQTKISCEHCKKTIRRDIRPIMCRACRKSYHKVCPNVPRLEADMHALNGTWTCSRCSAAPVAPHTQPVPVEVSEPPVSSSRSTLRILQWNADGIRPKLAELEDRLRSLQIDIAVVQETKLKPSDRDPRIPGFSTIRKDRNNHDLGLAYGGGLLILIKEDLCFTQCRNPVPPRSNLESLAVKVKAAKGQWFTIANVYSPPTRADDDAGRPTDLALDPYPTITTLS